MKKVRKYLADLLLGVILAGEVLLIADALTALLGMPLSGKLFVLLFLVLVTCFWRCASKNRKKTAWAAVGLMAAAVILVSLFAGWTQFCKNARYEHTDQGKEMLYQGKKVMAIVPHQDDEINLLGGVLEQYAEYGSDVYIVFVTNGDYDFSAEVRLSEAIAAMEHAGISENHLIFLGYGDQWEPESPHLYNAEPGRIVESIAGRTKTYAMESHPAYRDGDDYTVDNLLQNLEDVILEYRPEILFCSDYDQNIDHRAVSLAFEKVMGSVLKNNPEYRPVVLKGYAYSAAWDSVPDYHEANILQTQNVYEEPVLQQPVIYHWTDRVRLPVHASALSRSLVSSAVYEALEGHESQCARNYALKIVNSDKVFWYRDTNSLCCSATVEASSGDAALLTDFMLVDDLDLKDPQRIPYDGVWIPDEEDAQKKIRIEFEKGEKIGCISLYDHPDETQNILNAVITFSDGTQLETGPLAPSGAVSTVFAEKTGIEWMEICIQDQEGSRAGISEVEVFSQKPEHGLTFVKLMTKNGNFVYDYWTEDGVSEVFELYTSGLAPEASETEYTVTSSNEKCTVFWQGDSVCVNCPEGESTLITVECRSMGISDSAWVRNPGRITRWSNWFWQRGEELLLPLYHKDRHTEMVFYRVFSRLASVLQ